MTKVASSRLDRGTALIMRFRNVVMLALLLLSSFYLHAQVVSGPLPQLATLNGFATDEEDAAVPGASIEIDGAAGGQPRTVKADDTGYFLVVGLEPAVPYRLTASAPGFAKYTSSEFTLTPGQVLTLHDVKMQIAEVGTTITVMPTDQLAEQQVNAEIQQKVLGIIPNFYVVYQHDNVAPLSAKLKYKLAFKTSTNVVTFAASAFIAGINQAADTPAYVEGTRGYGERLGAAYLDGTTNIFFGGAILPALLHQDPRYFYQGTGTKKSRAIHALSSPFLCRGDNGHQQFNASSLLGDLGSSALTEAYYPRQDRGVSLLFTNALVTTLGRMTNSIVQEFILSRYTTRGKPPS